MTITGPTPQTMSKDLVRAAINQKQIAIRNYMGRECCLCLCGISTKTLPENLEIIKKTISCGETRIYLCGEVVLTNCYAPPECCYQYTCCPTRSNRRRNHHHDHDNNQRDNNKSVCGKGYELLAKACEKVADVASCICENATDCCVDCLDCCSSCGNCKC